MALGLFSPFFFLLGNLEGGRDGLKGEGDDKEDGRGG